MRRRFRKQDAELDITSFMNLMIILVPVLLMSMVFSHITVLDIKLPGLNDAKPPENLKNKTLELVIQPSQFLINFPAGNPVKAVPKKNGEYDFELLSTTLQEVKQLLRNRDVIKRDILVLSQPATDYQTIVKVMDTVRSYKAVVATSVVDAELFPVISLGDAPNGKKARGGKG